MKCKKNRIHRHRAGASKAALGTSEERQEGTACSLLAAHGAELQPGQEHGARSFLAAPPQAQPGLCPAVVN